MQLGRLDVDAMLAEMSSTQISEWMAFAELEPFGFMADMFGHALTSKHLLDAQRKRGSKGIDIKELLPKEIETQSEQKIGFFKTLKQFLSNKRIGKNGRRNRS